MNLMTLTEWKTQNPTSNIFEGVNIDEASQDALVNFFKFRKVCDNELFGYYFNRNLNLYCWQYNQMLRLESVQFDPMVSNYLESQTLTKADNTGKASDSATSTTSGSGSSTSNGKATNATTTTGTTNSTTNDNTTATDESSSTSEGEKHDETKGSSSGLAGATPQSSVYSDEYPESLDWTYVSNQSEGKSNSQNDGTTKDETSSESEHTETGTHTTTGGSNATTNGTTNTEGETTTTTTGTTTSGGERESEAHSETDVRLRHTGRSEAPQDMLARARTYILESNSFKWLVGRMESCFFAIFEL